MLSLPTSDSSERRYRRAGIASGGPPGLGTRLSGVAPGGAYNRGVLLGRDHERQEIGRALAQSRSGASAVLALAGEPGIGKTALLDYAAGQAEGMQLLRARGIESEAQIPFGSLLELIRPALVLLDRIPQPQAVALEVALALRPGSAQDRFALGAATLSLLAAYAEQAPVAVLVDDAQWLDGSSAQALLFAFRRLVADAIAGFIAVREGEPSLLDGSDLPVRCRPRGPAPRSACCPSRST